MMGDSAVSTIEELNGLTLPLQWQESTYEAAVFGRRHFRLDLGFVEVFVQYGVKPDEWEGGVILGPEPGAYRVIAPGCPDAVVAALQTLRSIHEGVRYVLALDV